MDAHDSGVVQARRKRDREDKARRAAEALRVYLENGRDLRMALIDLLADASHLAVANHQPPLDKASLDRIVSNALWCADDEMDGDTEG